MAGGQHILCPVVWLQQQAGMPGCGEPLAVCRARGRAGAREREQLLLRECQKPLSAGYRMREKLHPQFLWMAK